MFVDQVKIFVKGGDGGKGCVSFRREAKVPRGGPDGGVGGKGGDVVLVAVSHQNTLLPLRYHTEFRADRGGHGGPGNRTGRDGEELLVSVPPGTAAREEETGEALGEVLRDGDRLVVAHGGRGGRGNRSFLSNSNRAPREAEPGHPGEERWLRLDLRLIADVGFLGLPERGQVDALVAAVGGAAEGGRLPVHDALAGARRRRAGRADLRRRRHPRASSRAPPRAPAWGSSSCATSSARGCCCTSSTPRARAGATPPPTWRWFATRCAATCRSCSSGRSWWRPPSATCRTPRTRCAGLERAAAKLGLEVIPVSAVTGDGLLRLKRRLLATLAVARAHEPVAEGV